MSKLKLKIGHTDNHPWTEIALGQLDVAALSGDKGGMSNQHIVKYLETVAEEPHDDIHWCAAFVEWCLEQANVVGAKSSRAKDWLFWGDILDEPEYGCITIFQVTVVGKENYHVGFFFGKQDDRIRLLGGNQSHKVSILSVPLHGVLSKAEQRWDVMGYRWPPYVPPQRIF